MGLVTARDRQASCGVGEQRPFHQLVGGCREALWPPSLGTTAESPRMRNANADRNSLSGDFAPDTVAQFSAAGHAELGGTMKIKSAGVVASFAATIVVATALPASAGIVSGYSDCGSSRYLYTLSRGAGSHLHTHTSGGTDFTKSYYSSTIASYTWSKGFRRANWSVYVQAITSTGNGSACYA